MRRWQERPGYFGSRNAFAPSTPAFSRAPVEYWLDGASDDMYNSDWTRIIQEWPINGQTFPKFADSIKRKWDYAEYTKDDVLKLLEEIVCRPRT